MSDSTSSAVPWRPAGYQVAVANLSVVGAKAAMAFYQAAFGAEPEHCMMDAKGEKVVHGSMRLGAGTGGETVVFVGDVMEEWGGTPSSLSLYLYVPDTDAAFKRAVDAGAKVKQPPTDSQQLRPLTELPPTASATASFAVHTPTLTLTPTSDWRLFVVLRCVWGAVFWGERTSQVEDAWGLKWTLATQAKVMTVEETNDASHAFFASMAGRPPPTTTTEAAVTATAEEPELKTDDALRITSPRRKSARKEPPAPIEPRPTRTRGKKESM